jgi:S-methylmethionine-dependent homocysteine/selenocysteine methylase
MRESYSARWKEWADNGREILLLGCCCRKSDENLQSAVELKTPQDIVFAIEVHEALDAVERQ